MNETFVCDATQYIHISGGSFWGCVITEPLTHLYRSGGATVTFHAGQYLGVTSPSTGLIGQGWLAGDQSLYVGAANGSVTFLDHSPVNITTSSLATGRVHVGFLPADTCLWKNSTTKVICAAATVNSSGGFNNRVQFDENGNVYSCTQVGYCTP